MANEKYLTAEQEAKFMEKLGASSQTSPGANAPVEDIGGAEAVDSAPATAVAEPAADPNAAILEELGAKSVEDLANQLKESIGQTKQYREMLSQLLAYQQALDNKADVEPDDPLNTVKKAVREEMGPIYEKLQREAQNKIVQEAWGSLGENASLSTCTSAAICTNLHCAHNLLVAGNVVGSLKNTRGEGIGLHIHKLANGIDVKHLH